MGDQIDGLSIVFYVNVGPAPIDHDIIEIRSSRIRMGRNPFTDFSLQFNCGLTEFRLEGRHAVTAESVPNLTACLRFRFHHKNNLWLLFMNEGGKAGQMFSADGGHRPVSKSTGIHMLARARE